QTRHCWARLATARSISICSARHSLPSRCAPRPVCAHAPPSAADSSSSFPSVEPMSMRPSRRSLLLGSLAMPVAGCGARSGQEGAPLWYSYGGKNREVLERLLARFHADPRHPRIDATFQGDYFESLAKVRTAIAAGAAPAMTHVVGEVVPYLAEAGALE